MKFLKRTFLFLLTILILGFLSGYFYLRGSNDQPDNTMWQSYIGRDTTVGILPDQYANYFTYTLVRTNKDVGFKLMGQFPSTRYFSFNVYSLGDNTTQGSIVDYDIVPDDGLPNPFTADADSIQVGENYTVYILPESQANDDHPNTLTFEDDTRAMTMVMRLYDYNIDDTGGVPLPHVQAITLDDNEGKITTTTAPLPRALDLRAIVRRVSLPGMQERLGEVYLTERAIQLDQSNDAPTAPIPFHAIDTKGYIENNDNRYLLAALTKEEDEVFVFKFKAPQHTTGSSDIKTSDVRYWSFNLGNAATYNFNALKDEDAHLVQDSMVYIVMGSDDPEIKERTAALGYNFLEWKMTWKEGLILFRHMLANKNFEPQIDQVPPINNAMTDFQKVEAKNFIGDYAPDGVRMSKETFLESYRVGVEVE